jgi:hypothetical protein
MLLFAPTPDVVAQRRVRDPLSFQGNAAIRGEKPIRLAVAAGEI